MSTVERVPAYGSCLRCQGTLGLASVKRDGEWYCSVACAEGAGPTARRAPSVDERALYSRPRRFFRRRAPTELNRSSG